MTQQMIKPSYYILEGSSFVANLKMGGVMTLVEQTRMRIRAHIGPTLQYV